MVFSGKTTQKITILPNYILTFHSANKPFTYNAGTQIVLSYKVGKWGGINISLFNDMEY